jgi:hypothetical protein
MAISLPVERKTETELKLMRLMKQRDELLGSREAVERNTKAPLPPLPPSLSDLGRCRSSCFPRHSG